MDCFKYQQIDELLTENINMNSFPINVLFNQ